MIGLSPLDLSMLALYLLGTAAIGASFYRRKLSAKDYFLGGKKTSWIPIGISILAADLSAISVMGTPAWAYKHGIGMLWVTVGYPLVAPLVVLVFAPFYSRLGLYTAYEYLERRFNLTIRIGCSILFQILRAWHVAVAIYGPSLVLHMVTNIALWKCILSMGVFTTIYTGLGGIKAVIWTDCLQFVTVMGGVLLILAIAVHGVPGGGRTAWQMATATGRVNLLNINLDPHETTSLWACLVGGIFLSLGPLTTDQAILQRLFATRSPRDFARSVLMQSILILPVIGILYLAGLALFAFYSSHPDHLRGLTNIDALVPWFVMTELPRGIAGCVIASIFAASMAVMSAGVNALTTATTVDIYARVICPGRPSAHYAAVGRLGTFIWGAAISVLALLAGHAGDLAIAYSRVSGVLIGPMLGIFLLGILTQKSHATGVALGALASVLTGAYVTWCTQISFFYVGAVGTLVACVIGYMGSLLFQKRETQSIDSLTFSTVRPSNPEIDPQTSNA